MAKDDRDNLSAEEMRRLTATPFVDKLAALEGHHIESFHALPLSCFKSLRGSRLRTKYRAIFGNRVLNHDLTYTGNVLDTPVMPRLCIERSRRITAEAFGARFTGYVTSGTTTSNFIAIQALANGGDRVLVDRSCHQSIHMAVLQNRNEVTYGSIRSEDEDSHRVALDVGAYVSEYRRAVDEGRPYKLVIINGSSYEGLIYDVQRIMDAMLAIKDDVNFLVDEAWFSFAYFHPYYRGFTAMRAAQELAARYSDKRFAVVATQSAHKTLSAMRQGSYIHVYGDDALIHKVKVTQYKLHTTSPSYLILASLELARAQAVLEGQGMIANALRLATHIREQVASNSDLGGYYINESEQLRDEWVHLDPLRVSVNLSRISGDPQSFKEYVFEQHDLYLNHLTPSSFLLNIHIGVSEEAVKRILDAMRDYARAHAATQDDGRIDEGVANNYRIPYPPGTPLVVPGDTLTPEMLAEIARLKQAGVNVFDIPA